MSEPLSEPLFGRVMGAAFDRLPPRVRHLHQRGGHHRYQGQVQVTRGSGRWVGLLAWATHLPPAGSGHMVVDISVDAHGEHWVRHIGGHAMPSRLWYRRGRLCERLGLVRFEFGLYAQGDAILWRVERVYALGLRLPAHWFAAVRATESERDGRYCFDVHAALPGIGLLLHYRGWLDVD